MDEIKSHAGINISAAKFQILEVAREEDKFKIVNINETQFSQPINFESQKDSDLSAQLQTAFDEINLAHPIINKFVSFSLPQELFLTIQLPYDDTLLRHDLTDEFRWELSLLFPYIPSDELLVQYIEVEKNSINTKNTAIVLAIEKKFIRLINNFCSRNNLTLRYIDNSMIAANRIFNSINQSSKQSPLLNILALSSSFSIIININCKPVYVKVFKDSAPKSIAEKLTTELSFPPLSQFRKVMTNDAFISGEEISAELMTQLRLATGLKFRQINPFAAIDIKPDLEKQHLVKEKYSSYTSAAGVAFRLA